MDDDDRELMDQYRMTLNEVDQVKFDTNIKDLRQITDLEKFKTFV